MALAKRIDHISIAVKDVETAVRTFTANFGFPVERSGSQPQLGVRFAFLTVGDASLELLEPLGEKTPAARFLAEHGEGMYVLSLEVDGLKAVAEELRQKGINVEIQNLRPGTNVCFISPKHTHGVLLQLVERTPAAAGGDAS